MIWQQNNKCYIRDWHPGERLLEDDRHCTAPPDGSLRGNNVCYHPANRHTL